MDEADAAFSWYPSRTASCQSITVEGSYVSSLEVTHGAVVEDAFAAFPAPAAPQPQLQLLNPS
jgi:hypothetical protein